MDTQIDVVKGITNITGLRTKTKEIVERVRTSQRPMLITSGGEAAVVILDAHAYQEMIDRLEELEQLDELEASEIIRFAEEARRGGGVEAEEGIRIFEAEVDAMIATHRATRKGK